MDNDLVPLHDEQETSNFPVVRRGYDRAEVEDYVERVEAEITARDLRLAEDADRLVGLETQVLSLQSAVADAEQRAAGLPEPASRLTERLAGMLRLAEEEAEQIVGQAREQAARTMAERTEELDRRAASISAAAGEADQLRLEAQRDAEAVRASAQQEAATTITEARRQADEMADQVHQQAEAKRSQAEQDVVLLHEQSRARTTEMTEQAHREVQDLARRRDTIAAQLQALYGDIGAAVNPLGSQPSAGG